MRKRLERINYAIGNYQPVYYLARYTGQSREWHYCYRARTKYDKLVRPFLRIKVSPANPPWSR